MAKYIKKPVVIEAMQWDGNNINEISAFIGDKGYVKGTYVDVSIGTIKGLTLALIGDYIIKGIKGELTVCRPNTFKTTYEEAV